ncbi:MULTISPECIES: EamA family transporter [unclassified Mesorhizobium]|uniref:DMT family transporter n=1 Tax=unclassified Mesorhizobium TaxID=325217 RepID=UPI0011267DBB|nr:MULTISPECIES: EamA family transporter [unclassified Mesorhizobium]MBZ9704210.1 DMT family transporter [Mesorhizobium sp. CO1-1-3]MBZ9949552.1 DMT family transporter [Mesorhizobium sp. BR1-1-11]MCA0023183.1 DMT family transporter [Mesorhizobium sp. B263B1A]TPI97163.1 EamA/RhaT family transporter [Mesorhizobium sp. B2-8-1]TPJ98969.1 EamA/RhaT family transporter [Mesorhizobium sp. B2-5-12]
MRAMTSTLNPAQRMDTTAAVAVALTVIGWASAFPAIRAGLAAFGPLELGALRFAIAAVPAAIFLAVRRPTLPRIGELWRLAFGGAVFVALYTAMLNFGELTVSAGAAGFIINVSPIFTAIMAMALLGERFSTMAWVGTAISFSGIGIIAMADGQGLHFDTGALLVLGSALCSAVNTIVQKPLFARHHPLTIAASNMVLGALCLAPFLPAAFSQAAVADMAGLGAVIYLGVVPSLIAYAAWATALSRLPAARASNFLYLVSPMSALIGFFWLGEVPMLLGLLGGALALGGVIVVNLKR